MLDSLIIIYVYHTYYILYNYHYVYTLHILMCKIYSMQDYLRLFHKPSIS